MKSIFTTLLAAVMLLSVMGGCARDMSGETRAKATPSAATAKPVPSAEPTDSTADGIVDAGKDAVDGVVGAGKDAVDDVVGAGKKIVDDVTGAKKSDGATAKSTERPQSSPKATAKH